MFSLAADWLVKQLRREDLHLDNDMPKYTPILDELPKEKLESVG